MSKPRVMTSYFKLDAAIQQQIKLAYPRGFEKFLIRFKNHKKKFVSALPYEATDKYYMVKMTLEEANKIILEDEAYNESGILKTNFKEAYEASKKEEEEDVIDIVDLEMDDVELIEEAVEA